MIRRVAVVAALAFTVAASCAPAASAKVADGCTPDRPTFIGGTLTGYGDGRALDAHIGVSLAYVGPDGALRIVQPDGQPNPTGAGDYSYVEKLNPTVPATGTDDPDADRTFGQCVWGGITRYYFEVYPKDPQPADPDAPAKTNKVRYGSTAYYSGTAAAGAEIRVGLRAPVTFEAAGGNTGGVQGYVTYDGQPVPPSSITRVRAFPGPGSACGVEGYSAAADALTASADGTRTFYRVSFLAAGQCGAGSQGYSLQLSCTCGGVARSFTRSVSVVRGKTPRVDVSFG